MRVVLRQDPDVIFIGEMRDPETVYAALTASETGHLVLSTLAHDERNRIGEPNRRLLPTPPAGPDPGQPRRSASRHGLPAPRPPARTVADAFRPSRSWS